MNKTRIRKIRAWIIGGSVAFHAALAVAAALIPKEDRQETAAIELADLSKLKSKDKPKPPPPPIPPPPPKEDKPKPPPPPPKATSQAKVAAEAPKADLPAMPVGEDGFADMGGVALGNGGGGDGVAMGGPGAGSGPAGPAAVAAAAKPKETRKIVQQLAPAAADECNEPPVRAKPKVPVSPKYTMQARQAEIEGVVRVQVTVDETGKVIQARVLSGLGYGLDEAAIEAAKNMVFTPASRCGKAIVGTVNLPFRFELS